MIKKVIVLVSALVIMFSCSKEAKKDYATISGKIENATAKEMIIKSRKGYTKKIAINEDGTFSDTLHLSDKGELFIFSVNGTSQIFLKNNDDIKLTLDEKDLFNTLNFSGKGAETNKYIAEKMKLQSKFAINELFDMNKADFNKKKDEITTAFNDLVDKHKDIDTAYYAEEKAALKTLPTMLQQQYDQIQARKNQFGSLEGKPSPDFKNYENYKGGTTSLKDLRGKYVYIDVWATWCRPCLGEIPHLQKLEEAFKGKNIQFVSISVDRETAKAAWKKMIATKKMGGIQLFATKNDNFAKAYNINSIPRFILLDPNGNVVKANMTRPSNPKTKELLTSLTK